MEATDHGCRPTASFGTSQAYQEDLSLRLQALLANEDYLGAAAVKEEIGAAGAKEELEAQLKKHVVEEDYIGAATVQEKLRVIALQENLGVWTAGANMQQSELQKRPGEDRYALAASTQETVRMQARPLKSTADAESKGHGRSKADRSAVAAASRGSQPATGPSVTSATLGMGASAKRVEKEDEEQEKRQSELRRAQDQLKKCVEDEDYTRAAAMKSLIATLTREASAKRVEKEDEEEEKRQAELRRVQDQFKKCFED